jgi:hypothetical protein
MASDSWREAMRLAVPKCAVMITFAMISLAPKVMAAPQPSEDFYLSECLMTGHELGICSCMAKAFAPFKDAKSELVSAIMRTYLLEGDVLISPERIKQDLSKLNLVATDAEIEKSMAAALAGARCEE